MDVSVNVDLNVGAVIENVRKLIEGIVPSIRLNSIINDAHEKNLLSLIENKDVDSFSKEVFLCNYKKMLYEAKNCDDILRNAIQLIEKESNPREPEVDWLEFFFDRAKIISNDEIKEIWSKLLASEINKHGSVSKSLIHAISIMSRDEAIAFCSICRYCMYDWKDIGIKHPFIFYSQNVKAYTKLSHSSLKALDNHGIIEYLPKDEFVFNKKKVVRYGNNAIEIRGDSKNEDKILSGNICLTKDGQTLFEIVGNEFKEYRKDILDFFIEAMYKRNCTVKINDIIVT